MSSDETLPGSDASQQQTAVSVQDAAQPRLADAPKEPVEETQPPTLEPAAAASDVEAPTAPVNAPAATDEMSPAAASEQSAASTTEPAAADPEPAVAAQADPVQSPPAVKLPDPPLSRFRQKQPAPVHVASPPAQPVAAPVETAEPATAQTAPEPPSEPTQAAPPEPVAAAADPEPTVPPDRPAGAPVEIPIADAIDAALEAEIEAALSNSSLETAATIPAPEDAEGDAEPITEDSLQPRTKLIGKIQQVHGENVFLDLGLRSPGLVQARQFDPAHRPQVGQMIEVIVDKVDQDEGLIYVNLPRGVRRPGGDWDALTAGQVADCSVVKSNKGGLEVNVGKLRGFLPASQVDVGYASDLEQYVGQSFRVQIMEVNPKKRNLIVSRRVILEAERKENEAKLWESISVGQNFTGTVKTIKNYGAFVDIGGIDGFLHIGEISWNRIRHPGDVLKEGQQVEVQVLKLDDEKKRISLGMKQLKTDPWAAAVANYPADSSVSGKVTRTMEFGAFVELEPGLEGLVHISELDHKRVRAVADVLKDGQEETFKVLEVDPDKKRISLSLKALKDKPADMQKRDEPPDRPQYERRRAGPLKGGTGGQNRGGLFGNPNDFQ